MTERDDQCECCGGCPVNWKPAAWCRQCGGPPCELSSDDLCPDCQRVEAMVRDERSDES